MNSSKACVVIQILKVKTATKLRLLAIRLLKYVLLSDMTSSFFLLFSTIQLDVSEMIFYLKISQLFRASFKRANWQSFLGAFVVQAIHRLPDKYKTWERMTSTTKTLLECL